MPYRIYPINTRSRRGKEKSICILQLVRRLSLLHWRYAPIKNTSNLPPVTGPSHQATRMRGIFFWQVESCQQPFVLTQRLDRLFYACFFGVYTPKKLRRPVASLQIFKELKSVTGLILSYLKLLSKLNFKIS